MDSFTDSQDGGVSGAEFSYGDSKQTTYALTITSTLGPVTQTYAEAGTDAGTLLARYRDTSAVSFTQFGAVSTSGGMFTEYDTDAAGTTTITGFHSKRKKKCTDECQGFFCRRW